MAGSPPLAPGFAATLAALGDALAPWPGEWCVISGAALTLHGLGGDSARDIDILASEAAAEGLAARLGLANLAEGGTDRFRSRILLHPELGPVPAEVFAGFEAFSGGRWQAVPMPAGQVMQVAGAALHVARRAELAALFTLFGRPKDLARAALLLPGSGAPT